MFLAGTLALGACAAETGSRQRSLASGAAPPPAKKLALLLPLTGAHSELAPALQNAARLALQAPGSPELDVRDTTGSPAGAARAAREAVAAGDVMILGPLTAAETAAAAPVAQSAGVGILAFTNDPKQARPGVWTLGVTPLQQVRRLVGLSQSQGSTHFAGLLPASEFGGAMGDALRQSVNEVGLEPPKIVDYGPKTRSIDSAARAVSDYASRKAAAAPADGLPSAPPNAGADDAIRAAEAPAAAPAPAAPLGPPPFDALLLADFGKPLADIAAALHHYEVPVSTVRLLGPAQWAVAESQSRKIPGGRFAAPDPAARAPFNAAYLAKFGSAPPLIADLAYDAASVGRVLAQKGDFSPAALASPEGFSGSDGFLALQPDGHVRRGLAVFSVQPSGPVIVDPAPTAAGAPGI